MNKFAKVVAFLLLLCVSLTACQASPKTSTPLPTGMNYPLDGVPEINNFSGTQYEDFRCQFAQVKSVTLYANGTANSLSINDERVIRLLNYIANSISDESCSYMTGLVESDEITSWYEFPRMLEVTFEDAAPADDGRIIYDQKILISGNSFLHLKDPAKYEWADSLVAERKWPYMELFQPANETGSLDDQLFFEKSGVAPWVDLLAYAGL